MEENKEVKEIPTATPTLSDVNSAAERMEKANAEHKALIEREEKLMAQKRLAGMSGTIPQEQPKVETAKEYAERVMKNKVQVKKE